MNVNTSRGVWVVATVCVLVAATGPAVDRYVATAGTDVPPYTNWTTAAHSIQSAVNACSDGDVVWVTNGTYVLTSEISIDKVLTVRSIDVPLRSVTVDGGGASRCFLLDNTDVSILGFVITNGYSDVAGGGVEMYGGMVSNCLITGNRVQVNSGDSFGGGGIDCYQNGLILNCDIVGNTAVGTDYPAGGGVLCQGADVLVKQCRIQRNTTVSSLTNGLGGGVQCSEGATVEQCVILANSVQGAGGGVSCQDQASILDCVIASNSAVLWGGGFCVQTGGVSVIARCAVQANSAGGLGGGGHVRHDGVVLDSLLSGNSSTSTSNWSAGGLYISGRGVTNCTVVGNTASAGTGGVFLDTSLGAEPHLSACIVYSNQPSNYAWPGNSFGSQYIEYSCLWPDSVFFNGVGNITNAPRWRSGGDCHLQPDSPCIDLSPAGDGIDLDGLPRPMDGNFDGTAWFDAGCYEFSTNQDTDANGLPDGWEYRYFGVFTGTSATADSDGDAVTNLAEFLQGSHPRDDTSGTPYVNGLPTGWLLKYGLSVTSPDPAGDPDLDNVSNLGEMIAGSNPSDSNSYPAISIVGLQPGVSLTLRWLTAPRRTYAVFESTNLISQSEPGVVQEGVAGPQWPGTNVTVLAVTNGCRNYRLSITRPYP